MGIVQLASLKLAISMLGLTGSVSYNSSNVFLILFILYIFLFIVLCVFLYLIITAALCVLINGMEWNG